VGAHAKAKRRWDLPERT